MYAVYVYTILWYILPNHIQNIQNHHENSRPLGRRPPHRSLGDRGSRGDGRRFAPRCQPRHPPGSELLPGEASWMAAVPWGFPWLSHIYYIICIYIYIHIYGHIKLLTISITLVIDNNHGRYLYPLGNYHSYCMPKSPKTGKPGNMKSMSSLKTFCKDRSNFPGACYTMLYMHPNCLKQGITIWQPHSLLDTWVAYGLLAALKLGWTVK